MIINTLYQKRKNFITSKSFNENIQLIQYTEQENQTWNTIFYRLKPLFYQHASKIYLENFQKLIHNKIYKENEIPQLLTVNDFLKKQNNFQIKPVDGLIDSRLFLNYLSKRTFCSTQYIRDYSNTFFTPEPDICHELFGHVPMFLDKDFSDFSELIGKMSLNASDDLIKKLSTVYWFTIEFGLIKENNENKVFGAGILSSVDELQNSINSNNIYEFNIQEVMNIDDYPTTTLQDKYYIIKDFKSLKDDITNYFKI